MEIRKLSTNNIEEIKFVIKETKGHASILFSALIQLFSAHSKSFSRFEIGNTLPNGNWCEGVTYSSAWDKF